MGRRQQTFLEKFGDQGNESGRLMRRHQERYPGLFRFCLEEIGGFQAFRNDKAGNRKAAELADVAVGLTFRDLAQV